MTIPASSQAVIDGLERIDPEFFLSNPCSTGARVLEQFASRPNLVHFPVTKEEEGIGILSGLALAGRRAVMMIQDTGFGNAITALTTLAQGYHLPICIIATRTGGIREINSVVHEYSDRLPAILSAAGIYHEILDARMPLSQWPKRIYEIYRYAHVCHKPVVLLVDLKGGHPDDDQD